MIGGYGLFGIVARRRGRDGRERAAASPTFEVVPHRDGRRALRQRRADATGVKMAYGRLTVAREGFLDEGLVVAYRAAEAQPKTLPRGAALRRLQFRFAAAVPRADRLGARQEGALVRRDDAAAEGRIDAADHPQRDPQLSGVGAGRHRSAPHRHPPRVFPAARTRSRVPDRLSRDHSADEQDLLNVTLRYVAADPISVLAFAPAAARRRRDAVHRMRRRRRPTRRCAR